MPSCSQHNLPTSMLVRINHNHKHNLRRAPGRPALLSLLSLLPLPPPPRPRARWLSRPCPWPGSLERPRPHAKRPVFSLDHSRHISHMASSTSPEGSSSKPPLKKRAVVSSFLYKFVHEDGQRKAKVALFKRSGQVRTYPHHWAVISGSIDPDDLSPRAAAWREIAEETTLTPSSLELMRQGKSYVLPDESIGREWTIHPFAFRLKDPSEGGRGEGGITLDWEHDEWAWYDPMDIEDSESFGAVPRLAESLRRVWVEKDLGVDAGAVLTDGLDSLKRDHESGARQLATTALKVLRDIILAMDPAQPVESSWVKIRFAAWHIWKNGRESMGAAILSVLLAALKSMEAVLDSVEGQAQGGTCWRDALVEELDRRIAARQDASSASAISLALANFLLDQFASRVGHSQPVKVLTLSESSTITHALRHVATATPLRLDLRILESRPLFEGVSLANALLLAEAEHQAAAPAPANTAPEPATPRDAATDEARSEAPLPKLQVTLYSDASAAIASEGVDIVLLGADRIAESGEVSNKTGSLPAVLSAKHVSPEAKTVIVSETEKVAPTGAAGAHVVEDNDPAQLAHAWQAAYNSDRVRGAAGTLTHAAATAATTTASRQHVDIKNIFFEWVPPGLVDAYVTEMGVWTIADVRNLSEALDSEEKRLFRDI